MQSPNVEQQRPRPQTDYSSCLICWKPPQETLQRVTEKGYPSLLNTILKCNNDVAFWLQDDVSAQDQFLLKNPMCHARCKNAYTNRKTVEQKSRAKLQKWGQAESGQQSHQEKYLAIMLATRPTNCYSISVVGDRNDIDPSKSLTLEERTKRNKSAGLSKPYDIQDRLPIPQCKSFIANNSNKASLLNFIAVSWIKNAQSLPQGFRLILGGMIKESGKSVLLTSTAVVDILELSCASHEEADTRIFCHLQYAVRHHGYQRAVIQAADTDIILMALYHTVRIVGLQELWVQKAQKFLPCHKIAQNLAIKTNMDASLITSVLLSVYILTGCDTVSYPYRRGKKKSIWNCPFIAKNSWNPLQTTVLLEVPSPLTPMSLILLGSTSFDCTLLMTSKVTWVH